MTGVQTCALPIYAGTRRQIPAERGVAIGSVAANVVMQMRESSELAVVMGRELLQEIEQRDRIGASRHSGNHARVWAPQRLLRGKAPNAVEQVGHQDSDRLHLSADATVRC